jgi:hypothetical protein
MTVNNRLSRVEVNVAEVLVGVALGGSPPGVRVGS